ncbi:MAG: helix-turn-helix domain-containing protein [Pseudomonadota bacterium]
MTDNLPTTLDDVPASLSDVAAEFGMEVVQKLIENFGGLDYKFPNAPAPDHELLSVMGNALGRELCFFMSGQKLYIPSNKNRGKSRLRALQLLSQNFTVNQVARHMGISARQVRRLVNDQKDANQLSLQFDD